MSSNKMRISDKTPTPIQYPENVDSIIFTSYRNKQIPTLPSNLRRLSVGGLWYNQVLPTLPSTLTHLCIYNTYLYDLIVPPNVTHLSLEEYVFSVELTSNVISLKINVNTRNIVYPETTSIESLELRSFDIPPSIPIFDSHIMYYLVYICCYSVLWASERYRDYFVNLYDRITINRWNLIIKQQPFYDKN